MTEERRATAEKVATLEEARQSLADAFKALSADALQRNNQSFLELARATLEKTREVANAAQEQSQVSNSIAGNVERIAQMVEESDAAVQAAHDQVRQLDELARELHQAAAKFRL